MITSPQPRISKWIEGLSTRKTRLLFFISGFLEDFFYIAWISLALHQMILPVIIFVFIWQYMRSLYFLVPQELIAGRGVVFWENLGNALGAGISLMILPMR